MDPFINSIDLIQPHPATKLHKQRGIKRRLRIKTRITKKILHVHVFRYLGNRFPVIQVTHVFDDQRPDYNPRAYRWPASAAYTHLPGINVADIIPRNLTCQNPPPVRLEQLLGEWRLETRQH